MEPHGRIQKWVEAILADQLCNVAKEIEELQDWNIDSKANKLLFRALLCLSHTAERTKPSHTQMGKEIFSITDNLCYSLTEIPDLMKYFSGLYHVVRKLIAMQLYTEAMQVTIWTFPGNLVYPMTPQLLDMYPKIASLWHDAAFGLFQAPSFHSKLFVEFISNEFKVLELVAKENSAFVICKTIRCLTKLNGLSAKLKPRDNQSFCKVMHAFLTKIAVYLAGDEKYNVYHDALHCINGATTPLIADSCAKNAAVAFIERCSMLEVAFDSDEELRDCLLLYKDMGVALLKPIDNNSEKISSSRIDQLKIRVTSILRKFDDSKGAPLSMSMIGFIIQPLLAHWEYQANVSDSKFINKSNMENILGLMKLMFSVLNTVWTKGCEVCRNNGCSMRKHTHTVTVVSIRCLVLLSKIPVSDLLKDVFPLVRELIEENVSAIFEMKESGCAQWSPLWSNCGINIYNLSVACHKVFYDESAFLFSLLCSSIVRFEGVNCANGILPIKNALCYVLHRLSSVHFKHGNYREAMTPCALNGLLSYHVPDSKAFRMWTSIKHACSATQEILNMTMLSCLREDIDVISEIGINVKFQDYDLHELCLQELRGLHEARCNISSAMQSVLNELQLLNSGSLLYAHGVQLLGYHLLHYEYDANFPKYLKRAAKKLSVKKDQSILHLFADANIDFYSFVINLHEVIEQTKAEMETTKFELRAKKSLSNEGRPKNTDNVVPAYTKINILEDYKLYTHLQQALTKWSECIEEKNIVNIAEKWNLLLVLRTLAIVGEYSRLHKYATLETKAWALAYRLSCELKDARTCVYVVGRSTTLRNINSSWIKNGNELAIQLRASSESESDNIFAIFWLGLSNYYLEIGKQEEVVNILEKVLAIDSISPVKNVPTYLASMDTVVRNYFLDSKNNRDTKCMAYIVRCLYAMLSLMEYTPQSRELLYWIFVTSPQFQWRSYRGAVGADCSRCLASEGAAEFSSRVGLPATKLFKLTAMRQCFDSLPPIGVKERQLYGSEVLLTCTARMSLRMNSLLSFKEISSHLVNRLKLAQGSGVVLRVADCLKNLCFIDLSRMQLNDCAVKLQGLEYILQTEHIMESQRAKNPNTTTAEFNTRLDCRDLRVNDASPVLRKTIFKPPEFVTHNKCSCYKCSNIDYQYLVLAGTQIRAQLYFFQGHLTEASEHFGGAFLLQRKMLQAELNRNIAWQEIPEHNMVKQHPWKCYYRTTEYVLLLIDFSRFIREIQTQDSHDAIQIAMEAVEVCEKFHLQSHPIYISAKELLLEYQFCETFKNGEAFSCFTVPDQSSIDITKFTNLDSNIDSSKITTPASKPRVKKPKTIRRNKTPPLLKLTKVSIDLSEDETPGGSESPKSSRYRTRGSRVYTVQKSMRRKKLEKYLDSESSEKISHLNLPGKLGDEDLAVFGKATDMTLSVLPNGSKKATEIVDKKKEQVDSQIIQQVIMIAEEQETNSVPQNGPLECGRRTRTRSSRKASVAAKSRLSNRPGIKQ